LPYCTASYRDTNCFSDQTAYFENKCNNKKTCTVLISSSIFKDPCKTTIKYLDTQYYCKDNSSSSNSSRSFDFYYQYNLTYFQNIFNDDSGNQIEKVLIFQVIYY